MTLDFEPRTGFAQWNDRLQSRGKLGISYETRHGRLIMNCNMPVQLNEDRQRATGGMRYRAGDSVHCSLARLDGRCASRVAHLQRIDVAQSEMAYPVTESKPAIRPDCRFVRTNSTRTDFLRT